jgi:hypothetical protein
MCTSYQSAACSLYKGYTLNTAIEDTQRRTGRKIELA